MAEYCVNIPQKIDSKYYYTSPNYANNLISLACYVKPFAESPELPYPYTESHPARAWAVSVSGTASTTTISLPMKYSVTT